MKSLYLFAFLVFTFSCAVGQTLHLSGQVKADGVGIATATLQLKKADQTVVAYSATDNAGAYRFDAQLDSPGNYYLIASYLGMRRDTLQVAFNNLQQISPVTHDFALIADNNQLQEIFIKADRPTIKISNDTTKYNVARLTTADDRNLESVIRKMPGMQLTKDGTIYFKQQRINKILVEGDDMTGQNYKTITQNLKPQLVEEVQAIENYVDDDLLNGVIHSDDIVLNLKIKDKKSISGTVDAAYGTNDRYDVSTNLISFLKNTKVFTFFDGNNTGKYQEDLLNLSNQNLSAFRSNKLIDHSISTVNPFDNNQLRLNKSLSGSISAVSKVNDNLKLTVGLYAIKNKLFDQRYSNQIYYPPNAVTTQDSESRESDSRNYQLEINADQRLNKNSRLIGSFAYTFKPENYQSTDLSVFNANPADVVLQNQDDNQKNFRGQLKYVVKTDPSTAMITTASFKSNQVDQNYIVNSTLYQNLPQFDFNGKLLQTAFTRVNEGKLDIQGLKKSGFNYFYINAGAVLTNTDIQSHLYKDQAGSWLNFNNDFQNNDRVKDYQFYLSGKYTYDDKFFRLQALLKGGLQHVSVYNKDSLFFYVQPELSLKAQLSDFQRINLNYSLNTTLPTPLDYYPKNILTDVRNVNSGLSDIYYFTTHRLELSYDNTEFSNNYISFRVSGSGNYSKSGFLTTNFFDNTLYYTQKTFYKGLKSAMGNANFQKFFPAVATNFIINYSITQSAYYAALSTNINQYTSLQQSLDIKLGTGFKFPINISAQFQHLSEATSLLKQQINQNDSYKYSLMPKVTIGQVLTYVASYDLYILNSSRYNLLNTELFYHGKNTRFRYSISGKNLLDVKSLSSYQVSNAGEFRNSAALLGRYVMLNVSMSIN